MVKELKKRIASTLLASAISLSALNGISMPAFAADSVSNGMIQIDVVDSSVYGADRTNAQIKTSMVQQISSDTAIKQIFQDYWKGRNYTNRDFLYTPQGLGTFDRRKIHVFDITKETVDADGHTTKWEYYTDDNSAGTDGITGKVHYTYDYLTELSSSTSYAYKCGELFVERGGMVIEIKDGVQTIKDVGSNVTYGSSTSGYETSFNWLLDNHWYVMIEDPNTANSMHGYVASADSADSQAWQYMFQWKPDGDNRHIISYNDAVQSRSGLGIPLHNEPMRGNFSFRVYDKDLLSYESQGGANINDATPKTDDGNAGKPKFVVYNISNTATAQTGKKWEWESNWAADGTKNGGYVIADRNLDGKIDVGEQRSYIPAYSEADIINAYTDYLTDCNKAGKYNGDYANEKYHKDTEGTTDEFIIGKNSAGLPIIPVMVLEPDENGVVSTFKAGENKVGLPTGNYIVLQVQAGNGYYLDQDFRPIVSMGYWAGTPAKDYVQYPGYGGAYYGVIANTYTETWMYKEKCKANMVVETDSPVIFCPIGPNVTDISSLTTSRAKYFVNDKGSMTSEPSNWSAWLKLNGPVYGKGSKGASNGNYIMNAKDKDTRMAPVEGTSRFAVYNPVIRAGAKTYIADKDDVQKVAAGKGEYGVNKNADDSYIIVPQGNGVLDGAKFELKPMGQAANARVKLYTTNEILNPGASHVYTVKNGLLLIPVDDLPYGAYSLRQISAGEGYEIDDWGFPTLVVLEEDEVKAYTTEQVDADGKPKVDLTDDVEGENYTVGETTYMPNQLVNGGEIYALTSSSAPADSKVTLSIYNISDHYVYIDDGADNKRFETNKYTYDTQIAGKSLTYAQVQRIIGAWKPVKTVQLSIGDTETFENTLPYGTYLTVVTGYPADLTVTDSFMKEDSIDFDDDHIEFSVNIEDPSMMPIVDTVFTDASTNIDSIPIKNKVYLQDKITVTNLNGGMAYSIYGAIVDKATGNLIKNGAIGYTVGTAYLATDGVNNNDLAAQSISGANMLLADKRMQDTTFTSAYAAWLLEVKDFAAAMGNNTLVGYCDTAMNEGALDSSESASGTNNFRDNKARIIGMLKYMAKGDSSDISMDGMLEAIVNFDAIDTRNMEGKTLVAYEYICSATSEPIKGAIAATTAGELLAALDATLIADHRSLSDEDQTVYLPTLDITAEASYTGAKTIDPSENIKAIVSYGNIEIGNKYKVKAWLVDGYGAKVPFTDENGDAIDYLLDEIVAYSTTGESVFEFENINAAKYNKQRLTVYATLYRNERDVMTNANKDYWLVEKGDGDSMGYNITDKEPGKNQVDVKAPTVKTKLGDKYGRQTVSFDKKVNLVDTVTYKGLVPGGNYNAKLTLVSTDGAGLFDDEGNELVAEYRFTATKADMTIKIPIEFKGESLLGMSIVAYNDLYRQTEDKTSLVAFEHNLLEDDQTIEATGEGYKIVVSTVASNPANNTHVVATTANSSAVDEVTIRNLDPTTQYVAKTKLVYAKDGRDITQFTPITTYFESDERGRAKFTVPFTFNALVFKGQTVTVVQTIYDADEEDVIARHDDYNDANQMLYIPDIDTVATASDGVSKKIVPIEKTVNLTNDPNGKKQVTYVTEVHDKISYKNLIPGNAYKITTEVVTHDGRASLGTASMQFTPESMAGDVTAYIELDVSNYFGSQLVVYETISDVYSGAEVITHKDLSDKDQTVEIVARDGDGDNGKPDDPGDTSDPTTSSTPTTPEGKPGGGTNIDTGVDERYVGFFWLGGGILAVAGALIGVLIYRRKKND